MSHYINNLLSLLIFILKTITFKHNMSSYLLELSNIINNEYISWYCKDKKVNIKYIIPNHNFKE